MTTYNLSREDRALPLDWVITPALAFSHPNEVLTNPDLTDPERKAILASWASDAHAVEDMPWLRRLENGSTVTLAEVLTALRALDRSMNDEPKPAESKRAGRIAGVLRRRLGLSITMGGTR